MKRRVGDRKSSRLALPTAARKYLSQKIFRSNVGKEMIIPGCGFTKGHGAL